jgi:hypothetical protein
VDKGNQMSHSVKPARRNDRRKLRHESPGCRDTRPETYPKYREHPPFRVLPYGIGLGPGVGATPQMAVAHGGSGGVGIRNSLPWVAAVPPDMH